MSARDIEDALVRDRSVVRTWAMRRTLHLIAVEDLGWLLPALAPALLPAIARRSAQLGMDEHTCRRGVALIHEVLGRQGSMTRAELGEVLAAKGVDVGGQRAPALLCRACLEGVVCHGPTRSGKPTYVLLSDWTMPLKRSTREAGLTELVTRYMSAFGPAAPEDFAAWSGLPVGVARSCWSTIADHMTELELAGRPVWVLNRQATGWSAHGDLQEPVVRLLAGFDTYLLGYRDHTPAIDPRYSKRVNSGGGLVRPTILIDGRVVGTWRRSKKGRSGDFMIEAFAPIPREAVRELGAEFADVSRFLGGPSSSTRGFGHE